MTEVERYELLRDLPMEAAEIEDRSPAGRRRLVARIELACRQLRALALAHHWRYDLNHHRSLLRHLERERRDLAALQGETLA